MEEVLQEALSISERMQHIWQRLNVSIFVHFDYYFRSYDTSVLLQVFPIKGFNRNSISQSIMEKAAEYYGHAQRFADMLRKLFLFILDKDKERLTQMNDYLQEARTASMTLMKESASFQKNG